MARIVGLDLGSYSVKAVVIDSALRGYEVVSWTRAPRDDQADRGESLKAALAAIAAKQPMEDDQVVVALPGSSLATHVLALPFSDTKRIEAALPFEVEGQLPYDLSEAVYDYQPTVLRDKKTDVVVGLIRKGEMRSLLEQLKSSNLDPRIVTHPAIAYQHLLLATPSLLKGATGQTIAIVDIGHERTTIAIGQPGTGIEFARTFSGGGKDLTRAMATEFKIPFADASAWKDEHAAVASAVTGPDAERAAGAFIRGLQPVLREIRQSLKAAESRSRKTVSGIYLCGGTARMAGLTEQLTHDLGVPTQLLGVPVEAQHSIPEGSQPEAAQAMALALAGQSTGSRAPRFNLRRGEFAFKGHFDYLRERVGRLAIYSATLVALVVLSGMVRTSVLSRREQAVDAVLCDVTARVLGQCEKDYERALNMLKGKESPAAAIPKLSAVSLLAELSVRMPPDVPAIIDQVVVDLDRISARVVTDSPQQIDKITTALKAYKCFKEIREGKVEKSKDGQKFDVRLDIQVECPEDNRG